MNGLELMQVLRRTFVAEAEKVRGPTSRFRLTASYNLFRSKSKRGCYTRAAQSLIKAILVEGSYEERDASRKV